jgi:hypothetical protein
MLQDDETIDTLMDAQDSAQETVVEQSIHELKNATLENNATTFVCHWETCDQHFPTLRDLALHVNNSHVAALPWNTRY